MPMGAGGLDFLAFGMDEAEFVDGFLNGHVADVIASPRGSSTPVLSCSCVP